jgi:WD40 repeat protein
LWRADSGQLISTLRHDAPVGAVAFSPDGKLVLTKGDDGAAWLWRADSGQLISTLRHVPNFTAVAFSPDGKFVLIGSRSNFNRGESVTVRLWRVDTGQLIHTLRHDTFVLAAAFSPDGKFALTGSYDLAQLWRVDTGQLVYTLRHDGRVRAVAFSPDGKSVLTGSYDGVVRLWRVDSGQLISTLRYGGDIRVVAFSPDGKYATAMTDTWIHFLSMTESGVIYRASRHLSGPWNAEDFHFDSSDGSRLRVAWLPTSDSIRIDTLSFDATDAPPIEGDPKKLLDDWMKRLALKFDEQWKIVPSQPLKTVPRTEGK